MGGNSSKANRRVKSAPPQLIGSDDDNMHDDNLKESKDESKEPKEIKDTHEDTKLESQSDYPTSSTPQQQEKVNRKSSESASSEESKHSEKEENDAREEHTELEESKDEHLETDQLQSQVRDIFRKLTS